jgi:hypothetical protein
MKNIEVINAFFKGEKGKAGNLFSDGKTLINYSTIIAKRIPEQNNIYLNSNKYSPTTSKIQNMIRRSANYDQKIEEITEQEINKIA